MIRKCPVCDHEQYDYIYHPVRSPGDVVRCQKCGFVYIADLLDRNELIFEGPLLQGKDPKLLTSHNLDDLPKDYWEFQLLRRKISELPALYQNASMALKRIKRYVQSGNILDFGCGWGFFLNVAKKQGWACYGIEPLIGHSLYARSKLGLGVMTDTLREDSFPKAFFDVITAFQVFEHLPDPGRVLELLATFQKQNGIMLLEVPNIDTWSVHFLRARHRHYNPDHINFFSKKTMKIFLERYGYQVLDLYHPTRLMTVDYLLNVWFQRIFPGRLVGLLNRMANAFGLLDKIIQINIGDILGVTAIKRDYKSAA